MTLQAGVLVRISEDRSGDALGVERQEKDCRALAERRGWTVSEVYRENDTSAFKRRSVRLPDGTTALRVVRPEFRRLLDDITDRRITALIAYDLDRVARDPRDLEDLIDAVELVGLPTTAVTGEVDLSTDNGIFMARSLVNFANKSSRDTSRRVRRAMLALAEAGRSHGGGRTFGYQEDRVTPDPDEVAHVLWVYEQALQGRSLRAIGRDLGERVGGVRRWDAEAVRRLLTSPRYIGLRTHKGAVVGPAEWPAIVDRQLWDTVQAVILDREHPSQGRGGRRKYLLTGLLFCHRCGARLHPRTNPGPKLKFGCLAKAHGGCGGSYIGYHETEAAVVSVVLDALRDRLRLEAEAQDPTADLHAELARLEDRQRQLGEAFADGDEDSLALRAASRSLRQKADAVRRQIADTHQSARVGNPVGVAEAWDGYEMEQRRAVVDVLVDRVVVGPGRQGAREFDPDRLTIVWR